MSKAAQTHKLRKLRAPSKCRECDSLVVFHGAECEEVIPFMFRFKNRTVFPHLNTHITPAEGAKASQQLLYQTWQAKTQTKTKDKSHLSPHHSAERRRKKGKVETGKRLSSDTGCSQSGERAGKTEEPLFVC